MRLAGDIGGTKTNLALFKGSELYQFKTYHSGGFKDLTAIVHSYLQEFGIKKLEGASFAIAGPVSDGVCKATNLPWIVDANEISHILNIPKVFLLNDLEANAWAIEVLEPTQLFELYSGKRKIHANRAVISPGTGLGEAGIYWSGERYHPIASEGGHCEFGPRNKRELSLCEFLHNKFGHSSYERILSGPGLVNIYSFLKDKEKMEEPAWLTQAFENEDHAKAITEGAILQDLEICKQALDIFISIFGAEAGNCALKWMALGGIYLGGGIPPKILPALKRGTFLENFFQKGRLRYVMEEIPIYVILEEKASLLGAAHYLNYYL